MILQRFDEQPLNRKMLLITMVTCALSLLLACAFFVLSERQSFPKILKANLESLAQLVGSNSTAALTFGDLKTAQEALETLAANPHIQAACLYNVGGNPVAKFKPKGADAWTPPPVRESSSEFGGGRLKLFYPVKSGEDALGTLYLESDTGELDNRMKSYMWLTLLVLLVSLLASYLLAAPMLRRVTIPLNALNDRLRDISQGAGDLTRRIEVTSRDEIGEIAKSFNSFVEKLQGVMGTLASSIRTLNEASNRMTDTAGVLSASTLQTSTQAGSVSVSAKQVSQNVSTVSAATQEMTSSIKEIAGNASKAAQAATTAVRVAAETNSNVTQLGKSGAEIGEVIKVITSIAEQTNLLALNATIEAARAGEAGRGFAVVANEIKELARETARSAEDISKKIETIQSNTQISVSSIGHITEVINEVSDVSNTIATAVEQQTAAMREIGRNLEQAAKGSSEIASNINGIAQGVQSTSKGADQVQASAQDLTRMAMNLDQLAGQFKY
jgi:methyl-accepting chemotaxis protein